MIAVDMMGEGFDLPQLKVAALHSPHKSLAITLQFIGRFARTNDARTGKATFFAVAADVSGEAEKLFAPGAEWNEIVEALSGERIAVEQEVRTSIGSFEPLQSAIELAEMTRNCWLLISAGGQLRLSAFTPPQCLLEFCDINEILWPSCKALHCNQVVN